MRYGKYPCPPLEDTEEAFRHGERSMEGRNPLCAFELFMKRFKYITDEHNNCTFCGEHNFKESYAYKTILTKVDIINCKKCLIREFGKKFEKIIRKGIDESS